MFAYFNAQGSSVRLGNSMRETKTITYLSTGGNDRNGGISISLTRDRQEWRLRRVRRTERAREERKERRQSVGQRKNERFGRMVRERRPWPTVYVNARLDSRCNPTQPVSHPTRTTLDETRAMIAAAPIFLLRCVSKVCHRNSPLRSPARRVSRR